MGNKFSGKIKPELLNNRKISGYNIGQIDFLREKFVLMCDDDLTMNLDQFAQLLRMEESQAAKIFEYFDMDSSKKIDSYEFICAISLISHASLRQKASVIFRLYDFDNSGVLNFDEMVVLFRCCLCSIIALTGRKEIPSIQVVEEKVEALLQKYDCNNDRHISSEEFKSIVTKDPEIIKFLKDFDLVKSFDTRTRYTEGDGYLAECDSDLENEEERYQSVNIIESERREQIKSGVDFNVVSGRVQSSEYLKKQKWRENMKEAIPASFKIDDEKKDVNSAPEADVTIDHVYGYRCRDTRNNIRYSGYGDIVYHTASVVVLQGKRREDPQRYFLGHTDDITAIDSNDNYVATGQVGAQPIVHIWDPKTQNIKATIRKGLIGGVGHLAFSSKGNKLVVCCTDENNSICIYDISKLNGPKGDRGSAVELIAKGRGPFSSIFHICFDSSDIRLGIATKTGLYSGEIHQGMIIIKKCNRGKMKKQAVLCVTYSDRCLIGGTYSGNLITWADNSGPMKETEAHVGPVMAICKRKNDLGFITGGNDGKLICWDSNIETKAFSIDIHHCKIKNLNSFKIRAISEDMDGDIIIGTRGGEIIEITKRSGDFGFSLCTKCHHSKTVQGLTNIPGRGEFVTVGQDKLLMVFEIISRRNKDSIRMMFKMICVDASPDGKHLAIGCKNGYLLILDYSTKQIIKTIKDRLHPITCVKYSPKGDFICAGSSDTEIIYYNVKENYQLMRRMRAHKSPIKTIDFNEDQTCMMSMGSDYEVIYTEDKENKENKQIQCKRVTDGAKSYKDTNWATWTTPVGWPVQGIWPHCSNGTDIQKVSLSKRGKVLASVDDYGLLKLFRYPCPSNDSAYMKYVGHSAKIENIVFSEKGDHIITVGGSDNTIIQWKVNYQTDVTLDGYGDYDPAVIEDEDTKFINLKIQEAEGRKKMGQENMEVEEDNQPIKPYLGELKLSTPKDFSPENIIDIGGAPNQNLTLGHVFGYTCVGAKNCVKYSADDQVVFISASLGVVMNVSQRNKIQRFFSKHSNQVISLAIHPKQKIAATGQIAEGGSTFLAEAYIWDIATKEVLSVIKGFHIGAVHIIKFSPDGTKLLTIGKDQYHSVAIYDWVNSKLISTSKIDSHMVTDAAFKSDTEFVTVGMKHIKFWTLKGNTLNFRKGTFGSANPEPLMSVSFCFAQKLCFTGSASGRLYTWIGNTTNGLVNAHTSAIRVLIEAKNYLFSGGDDGVVKKWTYTNKLSKEGNDFSFPSVAGIQEGIRSLDQKSDQTLLVATRGSTIYEVEIGEDITPSKVLEGHCMGELWGLSVNSKTSNFVTVGDDRTIRIWDAVTKNMREMKELEFGGRAVDWSSEQGFIIAGLSNGNLDVYNNELGFLSSLKTQFSVEKNQPIDEIKISPSSHRVAIGIQNCNDIYLYSITNFHLSPLSPIRAMNSPVNHIDWSHDSELFMANSRGYELKFYNASTEKVTNSSIAKEQTWHTWTCKLGWATKGIFHHYDENDVTTVCRTVSSKIVATGDIHSNIQLFKYPSVVEKSDFKQYRGHSGPISRVRFTSGDSCLISLGATDRTIILWETDFEGFKGYELEEDMKNLAENNDQEKIKYEDIITIQEKKVKENVKTNAKMLDDREELGGPKTGGFYKGNEKTGNEIESESVIKPWQAMIVPPKGYIKPSINSSKPPDCRIKLHHVFGYRTKDVRNNLKLLTDTALYFTSGVAVNHNMDNNSQKFFCNHNNEVSAIAISLDKTLVATGQLQDKNGSAIYIWEPHSVLEILRITEGLNHGVGKLAFSPSGKHLLAACIDENHTVLVYNALNGALLAKANGDKGAIFDCIWTTDDSFVTVGINHFKSWTLNGANLIDKKGIFGKKDRRLTSCAIVKGRVVTGTVGGFGIIWEGNNSIELKILHENSCIDVIISLETKYSLIFDGQGSYWGE